MQGIYTYVPETNYFPREYSVAAILLLLFMVLISLVLVLNLLYFYTSTFRSMCAVPNMAVLCRSLLLLLLLLLLLFLFWTQLWEMYVTFRTVCDIDWPCDSQEGDPEILQDQEIRPEVKYKMHCNDF